MKFKEFLIETRQVNRHPSTYSFDEVMNIYRNMESFYDTDNPTDEMYDMFDELKRIYAMTDPEVRRDVEMTVNAEESDGEPDDDSWGGRY